MQSHASTLMKEANTKHGNWVLPGRRFELGWFDDAAVYFQLQACSNISKFSRSRAQFNSVPTNGCVHHQPTLSELWPPFTNMMGTSWPIEATVAAHRGPIIVPFGTPEGTKTSIKNIEPSNQVFKPAVATLKYTHLHIFT
jgi:hypothetical protein